MALKEEKAEEDSRYLELSNGKCGARQLQRAGKALANVVVRSLVRGLFRSETIVLKTVYAFDTIIYSTFI